MNTVKLTKDHKFGGMNLLAGSLIKTMDDVGPLLAIGVAEVQTMETAMPESIETRDPQVEAHVIPPRRGRKPSV